jgi:hypothetical protein
VNETAVSAGAVKWPRPKKNTLTANKRYIVMELHLGVLSASEVAIPAETATRAGEVQEKSHV